MENHYGSSGNMNYGNFYGSINTDSLHTVPKEIPANSNRSCYNQPKTFANRKLHYSSRDLQPSYQSHSVYHQEIPDLNYVNPNLAYADHSFYPGFIGHDSVRAPCDIDSARSLNQNTNNTLASNYSRSPVGKKIPYPIDGYIYQVQFKRAHRNFVLSPSAPRDVLPGDFVKVEADRGEDMGIVLAKCPLDSFEEVIPTAGYRGRGFASGHGERKYLYRLATAEERASLAVKVNDEERALEVIRDKIVERGLPMTVLDAEYQFDRHKLTFYFEADRRIDFRELVSELFSQYKTRIWMQQVDTSSLSVHDAGLELAKATGFLPDREECLSIRSSISIGQDDVCGGSLADSIDTDNQLEQLSSDISGWGSGVSADINLRRGSVWKSHLTNDWSRY